jgi:hypothetical protein
MADDGERQMEPLELSNQVFDISFHPHRDLVAAGTIDGRVTM